jgi:hypothetical protein
MMTLNMATSTAAGLPQAMAAAYPAMAARSLALGQQQQQHGRQGEAAAFAADRFAEIVEGVLTIWVSAISQVDVYHGQDSMMQHPQWSLTVLPVAQLAAAAAHVWPARQLQPAAASPGAAAGSSSSRSLNSRSSSRLQLPAAAPSGSSRHRACSEVKSAYRVMPRIAVAVVNAVIEEARDSSNRSSKWPQLLAAAPAETLEGLWQILFVYLAWVAGAERRQVAGRATVRLTAAEKAAKKALASVPCYHEQLLAAVGAPATWDVGAHIAHVVAALVRLYYRIYWSTPASTSSGNGSSNSTSSSVAVSGDNPEEVNAAHREEMRRLAASLPCAEALLLLLEVLVSYLYLHQLDSFTMSTMDDVREVLAVMLDAADKTAAPADAAAAAVVLLQAVVQHLPPAMLHAAAAAGCEGLRPGADENSRALVTGLQVQYAQLLLLAPVYTSKSECRCCGQLYMQQLMCG